jgi:hypothetical protein
MGYSGSAGSRYSPVTTILPWKASFYGAKNTGWKLCFFGHFGPQIGSFQTAEPFDV